MSVANIHNALFANGFVMNFEGIRALKPRQRYCGIQYAPEIHERLKFAKGESGYGTLLAMEKKLEPVGVTQLYPTLPNIGIDEPCWFVALAVPRRKTVYGYERPIYNSRSAQLMTDLRKSSFHGPDTSDALFYIKDSPGYFTRNPHCTAYWGTGAGSWTYVADEIKPKSRYPKLADFIGDAFAEGVMIPYPPPETKPKTVNEWDDLPGEWRASTEQARAIAAIRTRCPWVLNDDDIAAAWDFACRDVAEPNNFNYQIRISTAVYRLRLQYMAKPEPQPVFPSAPSTVVGRFAQDFFGNIAPPPKPKPPAEPAPLSKNGGRFVMLEDPE